ncbi:MAG: peroxiredoxin [Acidobacteriota bacterium]
MSIQEGDSLPSGTLRQFDDGIQATSTEDLFGQGKSVVFAVPGAFTPTCNDTHLPGFLVNADTIKAKGVDRIVCIAVNDPFVMAAWARSLNTDGHLDLYSDGNGEYAETLGLTLDLSVAGLGTRSARFAMIVEDGVVRYLGVEPGKDVTVSGVDAVLERL